jgi:beta-N-acetylhexosaminidase
LLIIVAPLQATAQVSTPTPATSTSQGESTAALSAAERILADSYLDVVAQTMLSAMSPEDRVGQLFVVNFAGEDASGASDIAGLIHDYRIGGVVLSPAYGNFTNSFNPNLPNDVASLSNRLQALAYNKVLPPDIARGPFDDANSIVGSLPILSEIHGDESSLRGPMLPLWITVEQLGGEIEGTSLRQGFTPLPNQMTLGATWDEALTQQVGEIVGQELAAVGINLLLGPSLDVYSEPRTDAVGSLGVYTFGGNPFWVSRLARAYIAGVHAGSGGRIATVARHFPGIGSVDRMPALEVATIQQSAERLAQESLPPFRAVTIGNGDPAGDSARLTDALMPSHMRYSAYQATGGAPVEPFAFTPALRVTMEQQGLAAWQTAGGLLMTNALGLPAIRKAYAPDGSEVPFRRIALNAFNAGNDLIYLGRLSDDGTWSSELINIQETIDFFRARYAAEFDFALQVDDAVRRIIRAKLARYLTPAELLQAAQAAGLSLETDATVPVTAASALPTPTPTPFVLTTVPSEITVTLQDVLVDQDNLLIFDETSEHHGEANALIRGVARDSITLLYPDAQTVPDALPPPLPDDGRIAIFSDSRIAQDCPTCPAEVSLAPEEIQGMILEFYGPDGAEMVMAEQITSHTFLELAMALDTQAAVAQSTNGAGPAPTDTLAREAAPPDDALVNASPSVTATATVTETNAVTITDTVTAAIAPAPGASPIAEAAADPETDAAQSGGFRVRLPGPASEGTQAVANATIQGVEAAIEEADWLIFAMLNVDEENEPSSDVVKRFLRQRGEQIRDKRVIVLALQAPYFLDATEIGQLSTYLATYSHSELFVENAVRVLFRSSVPGGAPPVSVAGTRFSDLSERLQPDARVQLPLRVFVNGETAVDTVSLDAGNETVFFSDRMNIQVGPILDYNGNNVPDGAEVEFQISYENSDGLMSVEPVVTRDGVATREILVAEGGTILISARSGEATTGPPVAVTIAPFESIEETASTSTEAAAVGMAPDAAADSTAADVAPGLSLAAQHRVNPVTLALALITIVVMLSLLLIVQIRTLPRTTLVYNMLWAVIVGLTAYVLYGLGLLPGYRWLQDVLGLWAAVAVVFIGMIVPLLWLQLRVEAVHSTLHRDAS